MAFYEYKQSPMSASNVSLCTIFVICPILHDYCTCWTIICAYISIYWTIYLLCVGCIVYYSFYLILLQIFNKCHTKFFNIFLSIFHFFPTFSWLRLKPTGKPVKYRFKLIKFQNLNFEPKTDWFYRRLAGQTGRLTDFYSQNLEFEF